ncbi:hypothetical protein PPYR_13991 [Photinus pyralis]|uniref:OCIA domain-containing protein n=1 Tax=Photinus pyralis TaxID=7054 RepID=A0A1Y1KS18_PHOPY|nr:OCIA domain-containing protein 1 [Photinus pyralis]KAB0792030.1 hypothetical protein PPYR_13991 [Photinus pyralis]
MENNPQDSEIQSLPPPTKHNQQQYRFTPEELRVLKECNRESFYQRSLPLCALLSGGIYYGVKTGLLKGHPRYGATPKIIAAVAIGYFAGKFSYQRRCAEKLMQLPNSPIAEMLRQRRRGHVQETVEPGYGPAMSMGPFSGFGSSYSDLNPERNIDIDTNRPDVDGLNDSFRPSLDNQVYEEEEMPPMQKHTTTYDELRKRNREEYQQARMPNIRPSESPHRMAPSPPRSDGHTSRTNKYGDTME